MKIQKTLLGYTMGQIIKESEGRSWVQLWKKKGGFETFHFVTSPKNTITLTDRTKTYRII